ncbi:MAG: hypothetical protein WA151_11955 [Desulfatirhabdiaceae bacterium]
MRARNIKPGFFKNEILGIEDPLLSILFIGLWCLADRAGRLEDRPLLIKAEVYPYREIDIDRYLVELTRLKFINRYSVDGKPYIEVVNFIKHQHIHHTEKSSDIPVNPVGCELTVNSPLNNGYNPAERLNTERLNTERLKSEEKAEARGGAQARVYDKKVKPPDCPYDKLVNLYHEICYSLPRVTSWNGAGKVSMGQRWKESGERQNLEWWKNYFSRVMASDFLTGNVKNFFLANLTWLVGPKNMDKVINGAYDNRRSAAVPERLRNNIQAGQEFVEDMEA